MHHQHLGAGHRLVSLDRTAADGARPGQWDIRILSRFQGPISKIEAGTAPFDNEVWSFQPQHHLRMVELSGLAQLCCQ